MLVIVEYSCPKWPSHRHEVLAGGQGGPTRVGQTLYQGVEGMAVSVPWVSETLTEPWGRI